MEVTDDMLMALADAELDETTAARLRARIAADPKLRAEYEMFCETARLLREGIDLGPTPDRLVAAIRDAQPQGTGAATNQGADAATNVVAFPRRRAGPVARWGSIAAALVLAFAAGMQLSSGPSGPLATEFALLPTGETRQLSDGSTARAIASYDSDRGLCRSIAIERAGESERQVICHAEDGWKLALSITTPSGDGFIPAADALTTGLDSYLDLIGAELPLEPAAERARLGALEGDG